MRSLLVELAEDLRVRKERRRIVPANGTPALAGIDIGGLVGPARRAATTLAHPTRPQSAGTRCANAQPPDCGNERSASARCPARATARYRTLRYARGRTALRHCPSAHRSRPRGTGGCSRQQVAAPRTPARTAGAQWRQAAGGAASRHARPNSAPMTTAPAAMPTKVPRPATVNSRANPPIAANHATPRRPLRRGTTAIASTAKGTAAR